MTDYSPGALGKELQGLEDDLRRGSTEWDIKPPEYPCPHGYGGFGPH